jgi:hypothetical protein
MFVDVFYLFGQSQVEILETKIDLAEINGHQYAGSLQQQLFYFWRSILEAIFHVFQYVVLLEPLILLNYHLFLYLFSTIVQQSRLSADETHNDLQVLLDESRFLINAVQITFF